MLTIEEQLEAIREHVWDEDRASLLRMNEDNENRAILAERVPDICQQASEAREMALQRWEAQR
jgi:hypothetical protein